MLRLRNIENVKPHYRTKPVELVQDDGVLFLVRLLTDAGDQKAGDTLSAFRSQVEEYDETSQTVRYYDPTLAQTLDERMNQPYDDRGNPCLRQNCSNESGFNYDLTGYVISDDKGVYVEKKCERCSTLNPEGDGDFHTYFYIKNGDVFNKIDRSQDPMDTRLFQLYDNEETDALETELYKLVDVHTKRDNQAITTDERDLVVRQTMQSIDEDSVSIEACLSDNLDHALA